MLKPYVLLSDLHLNAWQSFSSVLDDGMNSRLFGLLGEVRRAAQELIKAGGDTMYVAGDVFHIRGSIAPSVQNPTIDTFKAVIEMGIKVRMISGNHDLEGNHSNKLGSAITALEGIGVVVCHKYHHFEDDDVILFPWQHDLADVRHLGISNPEIAKVRAKCDLIIHAPLNGVITGLPDHGLSTAEIADWGFNRVFAGHHHNHKDCGQGVYSIGALAHHTWSDVNSKAGFLLVYPNEVRWFKSHLPEFIDIQPDMTEMEVELAAEGNFVRAKVIDSKNTTVEAMREWLTKAGAKGVIIQPMKQATTVRAGSITTSINAGASLEQSVSEYVASQFDPSLIDQINIASQKVLARANV